MQVQPTIMDETTSVIFTTSKAKGIARLALIDIYGRRLIAQDVKIVQGTNKMIINTSAIPRGTYFIQISGADWRSETIKVVKD